VEHPFAILRHPGTGESYTDADVARMSAGVLTKEDVRGIRSGAIPDPTVGQVAALAAVFGVAPSYLVDTKEPPSLDAELIEGLSDETTREITSLTPAYSRNSTLGTSPERCHCEHVFSSTTGCWGARRPSAPPQP
jgi:hypothetical protein